MTKARGRGAATGAVQGDAFGAGGIRSRQTSKARPRIAALTALPVHYTAPFFAYLTDRGDVDLTVLYATALGASQETPEVRQFGRPVVWDLPLLDGYCHKTLSNPVRADTARRWSILAPDVLRELSPARYDVVVNFGWAYPFNWLGQVAATARRMPVLLYTDTDVRDRGATRMPLGRSTLLSAFVSTCAGALYTGTYNRDFYIRHGLSPERLWFSPWAVDNERFADGDRQRSRRVLGLRPDITYFLFVGSFSERKNVEALVRAVGKLQSRGQPAGLVLAGSGPMEAKLRAVVGQQGVREVHWPGFVDQATLPQYYAAADVFVLPSWRDARATVVNEAMASGLPVVVSSGTGVWGPGDLVRHGNEGFVFDVTDQRALDRACGTLLDRELRELMGARARKRVQRWSYEMAAQGWSTAASVVAALGTAPAQRANGEHIETGRLALPPPSRPNSAELDR